MAGNDGPSPAIFLLTRNAALELTPSFRAEVERLKRKV